MSSPSLSAKQLYEVAHLLRMKETFRFHFNVELFLDRQSQLEESKAVQIPVADRGIEIDRNVRSYDDLYSGEETLRDFSHERKLRDDQEG